MRSALEAFHAPQQLYWQSRQLVQKFMLTLAQMIPIWNTSAFQFNWLGIFSKAWSKTSWYPGSRLCAVSFLLLFSNSLSRKRKLFHRDRSIGLQKAPFIYTSTFCGIFPSTSIGLLLIHLRAGLTSERKKGLVWNSETHLFLWPVNQYYSSLGTGKEVLWWSYTSKSTLPECWISKGKV